MTVQEMIEELYEASGNDTTFYPYDGAGAFDITTAGSVKLLRYINRSYAMIANFKTQNGTLIRFRAFEKHLYFTPQDVSDTVSSASGTSIVATGLYTDDDRYNGWILKIGSETRVVIDYTGASRTLTVEKAFSTTPNNGDTITLYKSFFNFVSSATGKHAGEVIVVDPLAINSIKLVHDLTRKNKVARADRLRNFIGSITNQGVPGVYFESTRGLEFDRAPTSGDSYEVVYHAEPPLLTSGDEEFDIPREWQEVIFMMASVLVFKKQMEWDMSYAERKNMEALIERLMMQSERSWDRETATVYVEV